MRFCPDPIAGLFLPPWLLQMWAPRVPTDSSPEGPPVCGDTRCPEPPAANDTWEGQCILFAPPNPGGRGTWRCLHSRAPMGPSRDQAPETRNLLPSLARLCPSLSDTKSPDQTPALNSSLASDLQIKFCF